MARLLSLRTVARRLEVSAKTVRRWVESGEFPKPVTLPGGHHRWNELAVNAWITLREYETPVSGDGVKPKK